MAARRLGTFLIHCWSLDDGAERLVLEHIQSGERGVCRTVAAAVEWMCARREWAPADPSPRDEEPEAEAGVAEGRGED